MKESELALLTSLRALEVRMARIPDDKLARLKSEVSVARMVEGCGVELLHEALTTGGGHAEPSIFDDMRAIGVWPLTVGAGRSACPGRASLLDRAGAIPATGLKVPQ